MNKFLIGVTAIAVAIAFTAPVSAADSAEKDGKKPVQVQTAGCNKCDKKGTAKVANKDCNKVNCEKTKDGKPCPKDCPQNAK